MVLIFAVIAAATLAISLLALWSLGPLMQAFGGRFNSTWFDIQGIVPVACMLFAFHSARRLAAMVLVNRLPDLA